MVWFPHDDAKVLSPFLLTKQIDIADSRVAFPDFLWPLQGFENPRHSLCSLKIEAHTIAPKDVIPTALAEHHPDLFITALCIDLRPNEILEKVRLEIIRTGEAKHLSS